MSFQLEDKPSFPELEKKVLEFWRIDHTFEKSVEKNPRSKAFSFYDGPPFATGLPHYGSFLGSIIKDVVGKYWTMKGFRVERIWGWDCHGLPIENMTEKELGLNGGKKGIEAYGIDKFNNACRESVLRYDKEWRRTIERIGRWVDMDNSYKTMDASYTESVWWGFKKLHEKGLVYQGRHVILYCPRCATPLSNFEIAMDNSYKEMSDPSTIYKFRVVGKDNTYLLAWSTTPWNKLATPALAVNPDLEYVTVAQGREKYILAKPRLEILDPKPFEIVDTCKGRDLEKAAFEMHYDFYPERQGKKAGVVVADDYVTASGGTGIVTLAVYGEDDFRVMTAHNIQLVEHVDWEGKLRPEVGKWAGMSISEVDPLVEEDLAQRGLLYRREKISHSVPVCYRCDTRLYQAPVPAWFIDVQKIKPALIKQNEKINWYPDHFKHGQFKDVIESSPDWNVSRSRYWGAPMPIWTCTKCGKNTIVGSLKELKDKAVDKVKADSLKDLHKPWIDEIDLRCDCGSVAKRIPDVFDCWVESASMPFASFHYPMENKNEFEERYPAQFIAEYVAQVRAWFNVLHRVSVALFEKPSFENVVVTGTYLGVDGKKLSKSRKNFPDPDASIQKYGVDSMRFYMMSSPVMKAESVVFNEKDWDEAYKKIVNILWNIFSFYKLYATPAKEAALKPKHVMDRWLVSISNSMVSKVTAAMDSYDVVTACKEIADYIDLLSTWYLRRSRERIKDGASDILYWALVTVSKVLAPICPFITEVIYKELTGENSVHLADWPEAEKGGIDTTLEDSMRVVRSVVEKGHAARKEANIKVRQPLGRVSIGFTGSHFEQELEEIIKDELNVKEIEYKEAGDELQVVLDTAITEELELEGIAREMVRGIQQLRKQKGVGVRDLVSVECDSDSKTKRAVEKFETYIKKRAQVKDLSFGAGLKII